MAKLLTKERLLKTAMRILQEEGSEKLTLDYLAKKAGVSKGGLLYHFPNKEKLIQEIIQRMLDSFENRLSSELESNESWALKYFKSTLKDLEATDLQGSGIIAALSAFPQSLEVIKEKYTKWNSEIKKGEVDVATASLIKYAADGIWFCEVFGLSKLSSKEKKEIMELIKKILGEKNEKFER